MLKQYLVIKVCSQYRRFVVVCLEKTEKSEKTGKKQKQQKPCVTGNLPALYGGMEILLELDGANAVQRFVLTLTERNIGVLEKNHVDVQEYQSTLAVFTMMRDSMMTWEQCCMSPEKLYEKLSFHDADTIHKETVNNAEDEVRLAAINRKILEIGRRKRKIFYQIEEYLSYFDEVEQEGAYRTLMNSLKLMCLQAEQYGFQNNMVYDAEMKEKEEFVRDNIVDRTETEYALLTKEEIAEYIESIKTDGLVKEQTDVLWCLESSMPCIVTGGAGTGKSTVLKAVVDCYAMHYSRSNILLAAPTGKAARRLAERTGMPACTIHKALRKSPEDDFVYYNSRNHLPHKLIVIDESSMIDTALMYDLLNAVDDYSKIIFVGDHNQLYPVGYGEPFFDFMEILPIYYLCCNHRQADDTDILENANGVLNGRALFSGRGITVQHISFMDIGYILLENQKVLENQNAQQLQIISPYNALNAQINDFLRKEKNQFSVGEKVILLRNTKQYSNGDVGYITEIDKKNGFCVQIEKNAVWIPFRDKKDIALAYAITVHKMQGSECDRVIVFLPENSGFVDNRMLYTAVTRARKSIEVYYFDEEK